MNLISIKKLKFICLFLTIFNVVWIVYASRFREMKEISIASFLIIQFIIVIFYFTVKAFDAIADKLYRKITETGDIMLVKSNALEQKLENGFDIAVKGLSESFEKIRQEIEVKHTALSDSINSLAAKNQKIQADIFKSNEKTTNILLIIDQIKRQELDSSLKIQSAIVNLKEDLAAVDIKLADTQSNISDSIADLTHTVNEIQIHEINAAGQQAVSLAGLITQNLNAAEMFKKQEEKLASELLTLAEKIKIYNEEEKNSFIKLGIELIDINKLVNTHSGNLLDISDKVKSLIDQIKQNSNKHAEENALVASNIKDLKIETQNKVQGLNSNLSNVLENNRKEIVLTRSRLSEVMEGNRQEILLTRSRLSEIMEGNRKDIEKSATKLSELTTNKVNWLDRSTKTELSFIYGRVDALLSIHHIMDIKSPLPLMNDWAISSDYGLDLVKTAISKGKGNAIDVGSGVSTLLLGYTFQKRGKGKVIALEHDQAFFETCKTEIKQHGLENFVDLYYCPLKEYVIKNKTWIWYDISKVKFLPNTTVISIDGPPGVTQECARYPAVPLLLKHISFDTTLLLDDGGRDDEKKIAEAWVADYNLESRFFKSHKGHFIFNLKSKKQLK